MTFSRRRFLGTVAIGSAAVLAPPAVHGFSATPDKLRIAAIGFGGQGNSDLNSLSSHPNFELTAGCDVDKSFFPKLEKFGSPKIVVQDYRQLFNDAADEFDAVMIATPDHMHCPIALIALEHDKHVYLQKPLAQDIGECRQLAQAAAAKPELATQMGIQIHAHTFYRTAVKWIQSGLIGTVTDVHSWSGKGWGGKQPVKQADPVPENLDWDLYVGVSQFRNYVAGYYHRNNWRKWFAFGTGTQGDMGCHIVDPVFSALELKEPLEVTSLGPQPFADNFALDSHVVYKFKGTNFTSPELNLTWYNGSLRPKALPGMPKTMTREAKSGELEKVDFQLPGQGSVFVGEKGTLILPHVGKPMVFTKQGQPMPSLPPEAPSGNHYHQWMDAAVGKAESTGAPFDYAGPLTETVLLGTIINRWPDQKYGWNADECKFSSGRDLENANRMLSPKYRDGW
ncbi:MAG: Gfo/Idh/MocA family oxidoreductase [Planctomycetota bacterium]